MVGAPPQQIGNFGGDTDNWMWPRQTGDFSLFRIYADKDNKPAKYSRIIFLTHRNIFFKINANGIGENDFTMVYGFPGKTTEYLSSWGVNLVASVSDPVKVDLRTQRIEIMEEEMHKDKVVSIQYARKEMELLMPGKMARGNERVERNDAVEKKAGKGSGVYQKN